MIYKDLPKILLVGPLPKPELNLIGGARVSFQHLVSFLETAQIPFYLVETRPFEQGWQRMLNPFVVLWRCVLRLSKVDVIWGNMSYGGIRLFGPLLFLLARISGKKLVLRPFGSRLKETYNSLGSVAKSVFRNTVLRSDLLFLQTQSLIEYFTPLSAKVAHLPTSREKPKLNLPDESRSYRKRFVFLGHVKQAKGIDEIIAVRQQLPEDFVIHVYGPIKEAKYTSLQASGELYRGVLSSDEVLAKLSDYDVLLLPTYFAGEGYPGAIIEAYSLGMPVISTQWRSIPEIVIEYETGRLIPPKSTEALYEAITSINEEQYLEWSANAQQQFAKRFEQEAVLRQALSEIQQLF